MTDYKQATQAYEEAQKRATVLEQPPETRAENRGEAPVVVSSNTDTVRILVQGVLGGALLVSCISPLLLFIYFLGALFWNIYTKL